MMLTACQESLTQGLEELKPLLPIHWRKLALNQEEVPLAPQFDIYLKRDALGEVVYVALRDRGRLAGYWVGFVTPGLHYKTCLTSIMDIWNVLPEYEKTRGPVVLMKAVEQVLRARGTLRSFMGEKVNRPCGRLYEMFGYELVERSYSKWLGA